MSFKLLYPNVYEYDLSTTCSSAPVKVFTFAESTCGVFNISSGRRALVEAEDTATYYGVDALGYFVKGTAVKGTAIDFSSSSSNGLNGGSIAGLAMGLFILVAIIIGVIVFVVVRSNRKHVQEENVPLTK
jgi:hypothetical protein